MRRDFVEQLYGYSTFITLQRSNKKKATKLLKKIWSKILKINNKNKNIVIILKIWFIIQKLFYIIHYLFATEYFWKNYFYLKLNGMTLILNLHERNKNM